MQHFTRAFNFVHYHLKQLWYIEPARIYARIMVEV